VGSRICARVTDGTPDGVCAHRVCLFVEARWGSIYRWEDYLDTERVAAWDHLGVDGIDAVSPNGNGNAAGTLPAGQAGLAARPAAKQPPPEMARQVDAAATRRRILTASGELMRRHGYAGTGVTAILAASAVQYGSLYHHFPAGKEVGVETIRRSAKVMSPCLAAISSSPSPTPTTSPRSQRRR
jgi:Bacterial regulatory proteins, tetR family